MIRYLFFNERSFLRKVGFITTLLILGNYMQEVMPRELKYAILVAILAQFIYNLVVKRYLNNVYLCFFYFTIFSLYPRILYDETFYFVNYYAGPFKLVFIIIMLFSLGRIFPKKNILAYFLILGQLFYIFLGLSFYNTEYLFIDVIAIFITYSPFVLLLSEHANRIDSRNILNYLNAFVIAFVLFNLYIFVFLGIEMDSEGSLFLTFGPLNLLVLVLLFYFSVNKKNSNKLLSIIALVSYIPIKILSVNTQELIVVLMIILVYFLSKTNGFKRILVIVVLSAAVGYASSLSYIETDNTWINLKVNQLISLFKHKQGQGTHMSNSHYIRLLEYELLEEQILKSENIFFGKGLGAFLDDEKGILNRAFLHYATFPENEIVSGKIHTLHESVYKYLLRYGVLGFLLIIGVYYIFGKSMKNFPLGSDKLLFISVLIMSFYFYGWSYRFMFVNNLLLAILMISARNMGCKKVV